MVNAGSTSLKLHLVSGDESRQVDDFVPADAVGHRVVHGGRRFVGPELVDDEVEKAIEDLSVLAPLHNDRALEEIRRARKALPDAPHVNGERMDLRYVVDVLMGNRDFVRRAASEAGVALAG